MAANEVYNFLLHYGVKGMKWGVTKEEYSALSKEDKSLYRKKTLKERSASIKKAKEDAALEVYKTAKKYSNNVYIQTKKPGDTYASVLTGKEFADYAERGGVFESKYTDIYGYAKTKRGQEAMKHIEKYAKVIWAPTAERYVLKK